MRFEWSFSAHGALPSTQLHNLMHASSKLRVEGVVNLNHLAVGSEKEVKPSKWPRILVIHEVINAVMLISKLEMVVALQS